MEGKQSAQYVNRLEDGRCIAVTAQPMPGGGTVATHQDITEQLRSEAKIVHMAKHDTLTGLPNRALLNERLEQALTLARRGDLIACQLLDLDYFKTVNDTLGHPVGDKLLCQVADRLRALVREGDTIARMGGDEFAILQTTLNQPGDATNLARRVIDELSRPYDIDGQQVVIGTSVGIAIGPDNGLNSAELMRNADLALYRAKSDGRNTYCLLRGRDGPADAGAPRPGDRSAQGAGGRRVRAPLPADRQSAQQPDRGLRGADPLAASRQGHGAAGHVHPARRGDRLHHSAR